MYRSLLAILREQGYCSAVGVIALPNEGSIRAHETVGFRKVGVLKNVGYKAGAWRDTGWWQLELLSATNIPTGSRQSRLSQLAQLKDTFRRTCYNLD